MFCKYCGSELDGNSVKCGTCGANIDIYDGGQSFFEDGDFAEWSKKGAAMPRTKLIDDPMPVSAKSGASVSRTASPSRSGKRGKKNTNLIIILCAAGVVVLAIITAVVVMIFNGISARNEAMEIENTAEELLDSLKIKTDEDVEGLIEDIWEGIDNEKEKGKVESAPQKADDPEKKGGANPSEPKDPPASETTEKNPETPKKPGSNMDTSKLPSNKGIPADGPVAAGRYSVTIDGKEVDFKDCVGEMKEEVLYVSVNCIMSSLGVKDFYEYKPKENKWISKGNDQFVEIFAGTGTVYNKHDGEKIKLKYETFEKEIGEETHVFVPVVEFLEKWGAYDVEINGTTVTATVK